MSGLFRASTVICAGISILALTACGPGGLAGGDDGEPTSPPSPENTGLAKVDPCAMLRPNELAKFGLEGPGEPTDIVPGEPGCDYSGDPFGATLSKNEEKTVDAFSQQSNWATFDRTKVNGRTAATAIDKTATQARICLTMFDAAGGVVMVTASEKRDKGLDECAESKKIAEAIEPRMPK